MGKLSIQMVTHMKGLWKAIRKMDQVNIYTTQEKYTKEYLKKVLKTEVVK